MTRQYKSKWSYDSVEHLLSKHGYKLLSQNAKNASDKIMCQCPNGHEWLTTLSRFKTGNRCKLCSGKTKYTYEEVFGYFQNKDCLLLSSSYKNNNEPLQYKCKCGNIATTRFRNFMQKPYCRKCAYRHSKITNQNNHNGRLYFQTDEFKKRREQTNLKKYGVSNPLQSPLIDAKRQQTNLKKYGVKHLSHSKTMRKRQKDGMIKKYGVEYSLQIPSAKVKFKNTLMSRYGVPSLAYLSRPASKESQKLFWSIHNAMDENHKKKNHFAEFGGEFVISYKGKHFKYDFVNSILHKAIEYNGSHFHPQPNQKNNEKGWCAFNPHKTVKEARQYEKKKYQGLIDRRYKILTVWDWEYRKDFDQLVRKCIDFLG